LASGAERDGPGENGHDEEPEGAERGGGVEREEAALDKIGTGRRNMDRPHRRQAPMAWMAARSSKAARPRRSARA
jgi:hypothetical protein